MTTAPQHAANLIRSGIPEQSYFGPLERMVERKGPDHPWSRDAIERMRAVRALLRRAA